MKTTTPAGVTLEAYFQEQGRWIEATPFEHLEGVITTCLAEQPTAPTQRSFSVPLTAHALRHGWPDQECDAVLDALYGVAGEYAQALFGADANTLTRASMDVMARATTTPLRITTEHGAHRAKRTFYAKRFDQTRLFGLELYRLIAGMEEEYRFVAGRDQQGHGIILEQEVAGNHPWQLRGVLGRPEYARARIWADVTAEFLGVGDLGNQDNIVITADGDLYFIDFDLLGWEYRDEERRDIRTSTIEELQIAPAHYDAIRSDLEERLERRLIKERERIGRLCSAMAASDDLRARYAAEHVRSQIERYPVAKAS